MGGKRRIADKCSRNYSIVIAVGVFLIGSIFANLCM
jgi:hypothetical protein